MDLKNILFFYLYFSKVSVPSSGQLALDLMCGEWGALECTAKKWFHYMGDAEDNGYVPFQINYKAQPNTNPINGFIPHDPKIVPCYEALDVSFTHTHSQSSINNIIIKCIH